MLEIESDSTLDLSPLEVDEVEYDGVRLRFKETMRLKPRLNPPNPRFLNIEDPNLGLDVFAASVSDLSVELAEDLVILWRNYAKVPDAELAPKALQVKHALLALLEELPDAR